MISADQFSEALREAFPHEPTRQQAQLIPLLGRYMAGPPETIFMLNGYAGTGKTSIVGTLVRTLGHFGIETVLLAPTGRAAKVFSAMAGRPAYTIHRRIYRTPGAGMPGATFALSVNSKPGTVFIVDEASMIGDEASELTGGSLLDDLMQYVFMADGSRLILLGDSAQLPPVGEQDSPALRLERLRAYGMRITRAVLTSTVRQRRTSGILANATALRRAMAQESDDRLLPPLRLELGSDVEGVEGCDLLDTIAEAYARDGVDQTVVITRSNRAATAANLAIRAQVAYSEEELVRGERLLAAKNNYFVTRELRGVDFVANGDTLEVRGVNGAVEERYGLRFAEVTLALTDHPDSPEFTCKIILDSLTSTAPALEPATWNALYQNVLASLPPGISATETARALRGDPYLNALQVKYAYAMTCHKAQGGQWMNVFLEGGALQPLPEQPLREAYRWLYTAVTRARRRLYVINPPQE